MSYGLVWFKRDLRWEDHAALAQAAQHGPVRCIDVTWSVSDLCCGRLGQQVTRHVRAAQDLFPPL